MLRFIYPRSDIYIHAQIYLSMHAQIYMSTSGLIYPRSDLYIHAKIYISICPATNQARAGELHAPPHPNTHIALNQPGPRRAGELPSPPSKHKVYGPRPCMHV